GEARIELVRAVALAAGPGFFAVEVLAAAARVRVLYLHEIEELFPVRALFLERRRAVTDFHPLDRPVAEQPRGFHVVQILAAGHRAGAEGTVFDGLRQGRLAPALL